MDKEFLQIAEIFASKSKCSSFKVAALAVKDGRILFCGLNGTPSGYINCCDKFQKFDREEHHKWSLVHEIHAEQSLVGGACKNGISLVGATIYITMQPCNDCVKLLLAAGIKKVIYKNKYDKADNYNIGFACECGLSISQYRE